MISIIIPAHDEASVIGRCLESMLSGARSDELEIVVSCNGCTDDTASIARGFGAPVRVVETATASKSAALNLGDETAKSFPRFYADADIVLPIESLRAVAEVLRTGGVLAAAPRMEVDLTGRSWAVRAYYEIWRRLPYHRSGMIGSGVYALSEEGRTRFKAFPKIISDDGFVRSLFDDGERATVESCAFTIAAPATVGDLIKIKTRSRLGLFELAQRFPELAARDRKDYTSAAREILRSPRLWPCLMVYTVVFLVTRFRASRQMRNLSSYRWERDESSRRLQRGSGVSDA